MINFHNINIILKLNIFFSKKNQKSFNNMIEFEKISIEENSIIFIKYFHF